MAVQQNFNVKLTLDDANVIKRALEAQHKALMKQISEMGGVASAPALAVEVGRIETLLRRDF